MFSNTFLSCLVAGHNGLVAVSTSLVLLQCPQQQRGGGRDLKRRAGQRPQEQREGQSVHASSVDPGPASGDVIDCFLVLAPSHVGGSEAYKMPLTGVEEQVGTWSGKSTSPQGSLCSPRKNALERT